MTLRASPALTLRREQLQAPGTVAAAPLAPPAANQAQAEPVAGADLLKLPVLSAGAATVVLVTGLLLRRRHRLARRPRRQAEALPSQPLEPLQPPTVAPAPVPAPVADAAAAREAEVIADLASQFEEQPATLQPQQTFPAPLEHHRSSSRVAVAGQKRLIKCLMWIRTVAGGVALLAAIATVVFWAIELIDHRSGDTGLTRPLLMLLAGAWAVSWGSGQLANQLHRVFFGRVHPKFDN